MLPVTDTQARNVNKMRMFIFGMSARHLSPDKSDEWANIYSLNNTYHKITYEENYKLKSEALNLKHEMSNIKDLRHYQNC